MSNSTNPSSQRWPGPQRRIGLTGGIATGKSSVGHWLSARGIPVLDADQYAREALAPGTPGWAAVLERYGSSVVQAGSNRNQPQLDRSALGSIIFRDLHERSWLEGVVHPLVRQRFDQALHSESTAPVVVLMVPLLFEAGLDTLCSEIWVVWCNANQQLTRLMAREGLTEDAARHRIQAQWPLSEKCKRADHVIDNNGTTGCWHQQAAELL